MISPTKNVIVVSVLLIRVFCTICKNDNNNKIEFGVWGSINIQHNALIEHSRSKAHKDSSNVQAMSIEDDIYTSNVH